jgi:putative drug exporter of the RND superfamily
VPQRTTTFAGSDPGQAVLNQHFHRQSGDTLTLAISSTSKIISPAVKQRVTSALTPFRRAAHVTAVSDPYKGPGQISRDGHVAFATVQFDVSSAKIAGSEVTGLMDAARAASGGGVRFSLDGDLVDAAETSGGGSSEGFGLAAAAIVLLLAFGSLLAMSLPIATVVAGIGAGLSLTGLLGHLFPAPAFAPIIAVLIGLGVGIDYALFIVTRFREALAAGATPEQATVTAMRTAGRTVPSPGPPW